MTRLALSYATFLLLFILLVDSGALDSIALALNSVPLADKVVHFTMFGLLALATNMALARDGRLAPLAAVAAGTLLVAGLATLEEASNALVPCRNCSLADLAANYLGILCLGVAPLVVWLHLNPAVPQTKWLSPRE